MKFGWKHYWEPTPKRVRQVADGIASASVFAGTIASMNGNAKMGTAVFITGFVSKIISNFFTDVTKRSKKG